MIHTYDTVILGCGEAGVFAGYELVRRCPGMKVLIVDQGADIYHRSCPIVAGKVTECTDCKVCHTMCGFGGAGAFSDGKYNFTTAFGGWLTDFMPEQEVMSLIDYVDEINVAHGATTQVFSTQSDEAKALARKALGYDLHLLQARCKHLGTENNLRILQNIYEGLKDMLEFRFNTYWNEDGSVNTTAQEDAPDKEQVCTDAEGWAVASAVRYNGIGDIHLAYNVDVVCHGSQDVRACTGPMMTILALTPRREAGYPYDAYFAGGTLYLAPQFLRDFPQAEEALRGAAGGSGVLPQGALCEEAVERLLGCGVLRRGQDGALRWIHSVHAPRPLDDVRPMASADWYV